MYSTPSRSSASRIMSAPVKVWRAPIASKMRKPPPFGRGLLRSILRFWLVRACPRLDANKAQESKEEYEQARWLCHEVVDVNEPDPGSDCAQGTNFRPWWCVKLSFPMPNQAKTLAQKLWNAHVVRTAEGEPDLLFVDLHLVHEVTSPQAFEGLRLAGRKVRRPDRTIATADHNVPTGPGGPDDLSRAQLEALDRNCAEFGVRLYPLGHRRQGVVHVI